MAEKDPVRLVRQALPDEGLSDPRIIVRDDTAGPEQRPPDATELALPTELPILPLRGVVVYPQTVVPLTIGQPRSVRLVDDVVGADRMVGLVASRRPELELPGPEDLYSIGTLATVQRLFRAPDGTIRMIVQGLSRFSLDEFTSLDPYLRARIVLKPERSE